MAWGRLDICHLGRIARAVPDDESRMAGIKVTTGMAGWRTFCTIHSGIDNLLRRCCRMGVLQVGQLCDCILSAVKHVWNARNDAREMGAFTRGIESDYPRFAAGMDIPECAANVV